MSWSLGFAAACSLLFLSFDIAAKPERNDPIEQGFRSYLQSHAPGALDDFVQAAEAEDRQDWEKANSLYQQVRQKAPGFSTATRRLCNIAVQQQRHTDANALCRQALAIEDNPRNQAALASALIAKTGNLSAEEFVEAQTLSAKAAKAMPEDRSIQATHCMVSFRSESWVELETCSNNLKKYHPDWEVGFYFSTIVNAQRGDAYAALKELDAARARGLDEGTYKKLHSAISGSISWWDILVAKGPKTLVSWVFGFLALLAIGSVLSFATLRLVEKLPKSQDQKPPAAARVLKTAYSIVLWLCCAYYYVSLPLVALSVVLLGGGLVYACFALGRIPIKLVLVALALVFFTGKAMLTSLFVRPKNEDPGRRLEVSEHPKFQEILVEVASRLQTRPVDDVFLVPGSDVAVYESGGLRAQLSKRSRRCLVLGAAVLDKLSVRELKAILAHEYGHFINEDTAGGGFAISVRRSLLHMAENLAMSGAATWYNPAWHFTKGFFKVFLRISQGASRYQEVLADRSSAFTYGPEHFSNGLRRIIEASVKFDFHFNHTIDEVVKKKVPLPNLYAFTPEIASSPEKIEDIDEKITEEIERAATAYDSHPSPKDRMAYVATLQVNVDSASDQELLPAWSLFEDRAQIEGQMTDLVRSNLFQNYSIVID